MSETRRGILRIGSNYIRLLLTLIIGLIVVRVLVGAIGTEAYGLIALLGSTVGIASIIQWVIQRSMVRELGAAYHTDDPDHFRGVFNAAVILCASAMLLTATAFAVFWLLIPLFNIKPELVPAARLFLTAVACQCCFAVTVAPFHNMLLVTERMVAFNLWRVVDRSVYLIAAGVVAATTTGDAARDIGLYGLLSAAQAVVVLGFTSAVVLVIEPWTRPRPSAARGPAFKQLLSVGGWNAGVVLAVDSQRQADALLMNIAGLFYNALWGISFQLAAYIRMVSSGMTIGLDAVAARLTAKGDDAALRRLIHHSTRLHGLAAFPPALGMLILADPMLRVWLGSRLEDPDQTIASALPMVRVLIVGLTAYAISDGWMFIFYGAGHIKRYAPIILAAALCNPLLALALLYLLPESSAYLGPAISYSTLLLIAHVFLMPMRTVGAMSIRLRDIYLPLIRPAIAAAAGLAVLLPAALLIKQWNLLILGGVLAADVAVTGAAALAIAASPEERQKIARRLLRRRGGAGANAPAPKPEEGGSNR